MKKLCVLTFLLVLLAPVAALADICDDVNDIADSWNDLANAINDMDLSALTEQDASEIDTGISEAMDATQSLADLLENEGNADESELGGNLDGALQDLWDAQDYSIEDIVDAMDGVVDALDDLTDYCDVQ